MKPGDLVRIGAVPLLRFPEPFVKDNDVTGWGSWNRSYIVVAVTLSGFVLVIHDERLGWVNCDYCEVVG